MQTGASNNDVAKTEEGDSRQPGKGERGLSSQHPTYSSPFSFFRCLGVSAGKRRRETAMGAVARICLQSLLKLVNMIIGFVGMGMILYALWMVRNWYRQMGGDFWSGPNPPWFIFSFLGLGILLCVITCSGHIAAETANGPCLSCYSAFIFLLVVLEGAVTADIFLNDNWEEDFPYDPTGRFDEFKDFIKSNFEICKWIGLAIVTAQALSIFLATVLRALGPDRARRCDSDDDDDYVPVRLPLLVNQVQHPSYVAAEPRVILKNDSWSQRNIV